MRVSVLLIIGPAVQHIVATFLEIVADLLVVIALIGAVLHQPDMGRPATGIAPDVERVGRSFRPLTNLMKCRIIGLTGHLATLARNIIHRQADTRLVAPRA